MLLLICNQIVSKDQYFPSFDIYLFLMAIGIRSKYSEIFIKKTQTTPMRKLKYCLVTKYFCDIIPHEGVAGCFDRLTMVASWGNFQFFQKYSGSLFLFGY